MSKIKVRALFLDIGGVLLTNGWGRNSRKLAAGHFNLDFADMDERHHLTFDTYEIGKLSLDEYLNRAVFYRDRSFSREQFKAFMFEQSQPFPDMMNLIKSIKRRHGIKTVAVNNEGRELSAHRIRKFALDSFIDFFVSSCFVRFRKPDIEIYRIALDIGQVPAAETLYIDDRSLFTEVASTLGIESIHHRSHEETRRALDSFGLRTGEMSGQETRAA